MNNYLFRSLSGVCLCLFLYSMVGSLNVFSQPVVIRVDQPNIWTLDQAHYLLSQMRRRNLDLKTPVSKMRDLDPNAVHGSAVDVLQNLLAVSAQFDQSVGANNEITRLNNSDIRSEKQFISSQRRALTVRRGELQASSLKITSQIADLKIKKLRAKTDEEKEKIQAEIDELTVVQEVLKEQITQINGDLESLPATDRNFENFSVPTAVPEMSDPKLTSVLATMADKIREQIENKPELNASVRLDNYIQLQYEIISKQLTLIRDEVGPGERLVFLELPQSINVSYDNSKNKLAQSWWKIRGYSECHVSDADGNTAACSKYPDIAGVQRKAGSTSSELVQEVSKLTLGPKPPPYKVDSLFVSGEDMGSPDQVKNVLGTILDEPARLSSKSARSAFVRELKNALTQEQLDLLKAYRESLNAYLKCFQAPETGCRESITSYVDQRQTFSEGLQIIFRQFIHKELLREDNPAWASISVRVDGAFRARPQEEKPLVESDNRLFRRLVLDEVFKGGINGWRTVYQKLVDLDPQDNNVGTLPAVTPNSQANKNPGNVAAAPQSAATPHSAFDAFSSANYSSRTVRTIDLFPKQGSLNVNDLKVRTDQISLRAIFGFLTGFGAKANYERMRERYSQFVQQELYSSAFGKGGREFGWTFYPMPGTNRLLSGIRTTYAIVVIPEDTTSLIFEAKGCFFPRSSEQPGDYAQTGKLNESDSSRGCTNSKTLIVPLPNGGNPFSNTFSVTKLSYNSVTKGDKVILSIEGENLSPEIGIVVNGVALSPSIGLAQPFIRDDSTVATEVAAETANNSIKGSFERINARKIVATFHMEREFQGTPIITLITPGASEILNHDPDLEVVESGDSYPNLTYAPYIFGRRFDKKSTITSVEDIQSFLVDREHLRILLKGQKLKDGGTAVVKKLLVNGEVMDECVPPSKTSCFTIISDNLISFPLNIPPQISTIKVSVVTDLGTLDTVSVSNPASGSETKGDPPLAKYKVDRAKFSFEDYKLETCTVKNGQYDIVIRISGKGLGDNTKAYIGTRDLPTVAEDGKLLVSISNAGSMQKLMLQDPVQQLQDHKTVIFAKPEKGCLEK